MDVIFYAEATKSPQRTAYTAWKLLGEQVGVYTGEYWLPGT
jgi:hypothetical protein